MRFCDESRGGKAATLRTVALTCIDFAAVFRNTQSRMMIKKKNGRAKGITQGLINAFPSFEFLLAGKIVHLSCALGR